MKSKRFLLTISFLVTIFSFSTLAFEAVSVSSINQLDCSKTTNDINGLRAQQMHFDSAQCQHRLISLEIFSQRNIALAKTSMASKRPLRITYICENSNCGDCTLVSMSSPNRTQDSACLH